MNTVIVVTIATIILTLAIIAARQLSKTTYKMKFNLPKVRVKLENLHVPNASWDCEGLEIEIGACGGETEMSMAMVRWFTSNFPNIVSEVVGEVIEGSSKMSPQSGRLPISILNYGKGPAEKDSSIL